MARIDPKWIELLSSKRFRRHEDDVFDDRGPFDRDYDRIVHSSNFRRLKDKTQVFPLSKNDFVRTRLTHSLEVSCIGRTLGRSVQKLLNEEVTGHADISAIVAAACLGHDIGNPPFGHSGEFAIQAWARQNVRSRNDNPGSQYTVESDYERQDLHDFDGNAQSLRVVSRIQTRRRRGGMQLTLATLGAMMKYPCGSLIDGKPRTKDIDQKKCGYFQDDAKHISIALHEMKLPSYADGAFRRHPLAFLVEAADDISNVVVDLEDSVDQRLIRTEEAIGLLKPIAAASEGYSRKYHDDRDELERLRAYATNVFVNACAETFKTNLDQIFAGEYRTSLIDDTPHLESYDAIRTVISTRAYQHPSVLEIEAAGFKVIDALLNLFVPALVDPKSHVEKKLLALFPIDYLRRPDIAIIDRIEALNGLTTYQRILAVTDYISGMTDSFAVDLFQKLSGIRLAS